MLLIADPYRGRKPNGSYSNQQDAYSANICLDYPAPTDVAAYTRWATKFDGTAPHFAAMIAYNDLVCAFWPVPAERVPHKVSAPGAPPIVVVGSTGDPATPYAWSVALAKELESGVLVTREGEGHTGYARATASRRRSTPTCSTSRCPRTGCAATRDPDQPASGRLALPTTISRNDVSTTSIPAMTSGDDERQRVAQRPSRPPAAAAASARNSEPHAADQPGHVRRPAGQPSQRARQQDDGRDRPTAPTSAARIERRRMDDRLERTGRRAEQRGAPTASAPSPSAPNPATRGLTPEPARRAAGRMLVIELDLVRPRRRRSATRGRSARRSPGRPRRRRARRGRTAPPGRTRGRCPSATGTAGVWRVRVDDRPEDLVGVVGRDRQPEQVVGVDLVAVRRGGLVAGRLEAERLPAVAPPARSPTIEAARLVRVARRGRASTIASRIARRQATAGPGPGSAASLTTS